MQESNIKNKFNSKKLFTRIFLLAIFVRLICLYLFRNIANYDLESYLQVGELTLKGVNIYPKIANLHHPYLPFFLYIEAFAIHISQIGLIRLMSPIWIIKSILIFFDLGILYLVYLLSKKNLKTVFVYAVNPVTILITTMHGQFDVMPIFFLLLSVHLLNKKNIIISVLFFSLSILVKTWPALFIVPFVRKIKSKKIVLLIFLFPIIFVVIYIWLFKSNLIYIAKTIIYYQGLWGIWGIWAWLGKTRIFWQKMSTLLFLLSFFGYSWFNKSKSIIKNIFQLLLFFFIFTTNFSIQYFTWIMPFLILQRPKKYLSLIFLILVYLLSFYSIWLFDFKVENSPPLLIFLQNFIGFILWINFIKVGCLLQK